MQPALHVIRCPCPRRRWASAASCRPAQHPRLLPLPSCPCPADAAAAAAAAGVVGGAVAQRGLRLLPGVPGSLCRWVGGWTGGDRARCQGRPASCCCSDCCTRPHLHHQRLPTLTPCLSHPSLLLSTPLSAAQSPPYFFQTFYTDDVPYALYFDSKRSSHPLSMDAGGRGGRGHAKGVQVGGGRAKGNRRAAASALSLTPHASCAPRASWLPRSPSAAALNSSSAIESVFDAVEYEKGGAVLRMLRAWANRANRHLLPPRHELTTPGATPKQVGAEGLAYFSCWPAPSMSGAISPASEHTSKVRPPTPPPASSTLARRPPLYRCRTASCSGCSSTCSGTPTTPPPPPTCGRRWSVSAREA